MTPCVKPHSRPHCLVSPSPSSPGAWHLGRSSLGAQRISIYTSHCCFLTLLEPSDFAPLAQSLSAFPNLSDGPFSNSMRLTPVPGRPFPRTCSSRCPSGPFHHKPSHQLPRFSFSPGGRSGSLSRFPARPPPTEYSPHLFPGKLLFLLSSSPLLEATLFSPNSQETRAPS